MSSTQTLESKLKALQCHFTWDLEPNMSKLAYLSGTLEDISTDEGNFWLGHIYNLQGFIQYKLGSTEEALKLFNKATETFQEMKNTDEGPWLMVNFGNLAWLHLHLGTDEKSQDYLSKVDALMRKYPPPPEEELHPEVCAEKAWTLMKFDKEKKLQAAELFKKAIQKQPDTPEWQSNYVILSAEAFKDDLKKLYAERLEMLRSASKQDPDNLCVAALYLEARAAKGEHIQDEARSLAEKLKERPASSYNGINPLLRLYRKFKSEVNADETSEEAQRQTQSKRSAAEGLTKKIFSNNYQPDEINEAIRLWKEVIGADPKSKFDLQEKTLEDQITLASIYAKVEKEKADQIYEELLKREDLDPAGKQILYNRYAKHLYFISNDSRRSTEFHMKAAEIPEESRYRQSSIMELKKTSGRNKDPEMYRRIKELLARLGNQPETQNQ
ncbi:interferon-induced protein with tetratricopeptide repeats 1-like [Girardinichthys multiradiatus]|uniref:interferon-induced protein with tetratricopeptide repeats 1-like n=1 Tax=Girardinichthys multiradiatus TaxID=208333 RepID=UPI001FACED6E|nr:interferon-induced protein with tetratricopeptide repeats 1-like [Girardinichthys multiradiatus]